MTSVTPSRTAAEECARAALAEHGTGRGPLLPILHAVREELGCVPRDVIPVIADGLNLSIAEVHGVVTFYRDFRSEPAGRTTVRVCRAEACQARGAAELVAHAQAELGIGLGATTADGAVTLDEVFCLGNCALGPAITVGERLYGRVTPARFDALLGEVR
ncbi:formate dehydrogenase subunit gamma [Pseudonocardia sp. CA-107938]|uniref:formate dehydrogenase subunit gamma n=1 Tax=Pseudonocardia sp. CA-107938 TaxID=3240021 RepID=UPI003D91E242